MLQQPPERNNSANVLIYLPRGPSEDNPERDASNISILRSQSSCPIAQINYRLSSQHRYPTPIHDVLSGFDWLVDNLLPKRGITRVGRSESIGQFVVYGEHIGGSLATALGLTECRIGRPGIVAAAVSDPVVDWISIDQNVHPKAHVGGLKKAILGDHSALLEFQELRELRARLFKRPEHYFDPFASPILFFRSAGAEVPPPSPELPTNDLEQLSLLEREQLDRQEANSASSETDSVTAGIDPRNAVLRKASRRFPSKTLNLRLPQFFIATSNTSPLRSQADELANVLRQSFVRQAKDATPGSSDFGRKVLTDEELDEDERVLAKALIIQAAKKVILHVGDNAGTWSDSLDGNARLCEAAKWLRDKLE